MKPFYPTRTFLCSLMILFIFSSRSYAQLCANGATPLSDVYDSTVSGGGNDLFNLQFPQFDPTKGTLISVKLETVVTLKYSFQLENNNSNQFTYRVKVTREDEIDYPGGHIDHSNFQNVGIYPLAGSDGVTGQGKDYIEDGPLYAFNQLHNVYDLSTNVAGFLGNSNVSIDYNTSSFANAIGSLNNTLRGEAEDSIGFKITYLYCPAIILPADISNFTAYKQSSGSVQLNWYSSNNRPGKKFDVQKSADARNFSTFETVVSKSNLATAYQAIYKPVKEDKKKIFFRIKEWGENGSFKYTPIKDVSFPADNSTPMQVYPTIATNGVNIYFPITNKSDWQVNIIALTGQVMQQSTFSGTNFLKVKFNQKLPAGFYIVETINKRTQETQKAKIIIE